MQTFIRANAFKVENSYKMLMSSIILHMQVEKSWEILQSFPQMKFKEK
jgi:hypothetical protein